ncbi:MAG: hypothetical protein B9S38_06485 [Verrucomicrobiia bacterium Tous-C4TDCM]|nr:MAG: hypothetical protein B9S38_06485 [Verrucomicrobiae bacterium Tous-C4TDCM]
MKPTSPGQRLLLAGASCLSLLLAPAARADGSDDFNDNSKNPAKWGTDVVTGNGALNETANVLRYTCANGTAEDNVARPWNATRFPYNADWEVQVDCFNNSSPVAPLQVNSMGITLESPLSGDTFLYHEVYNSALGIGTTERTGFETRMDVNGVSGGGEDSGGMTFTSGAVRMSWNGTTHVLTCEYDDDPTDGYQWTYLSSFGLSGAGGTYNADWGMAPTDQFFISVYGYSSAMNVPAGQLHLDNFSETGGVPSGGGTRPEPTGSFPIAFPAGNDLLTRILSLIGNYQGISPVAPQRAYNFDVAQDESGKVMSMGTVSGVQDSSGNSDLAVSLGQVRTVNEEPVAEVKSSFKGSADGMDASFKSTGSFPLDQVENANTLRVAGAEAVPLGVSGNWTYSGKANGIPFSGKNEPLEFEIPPGAEGNVKQDWALQLDITPKIIQGKERVVASATLVLPDGTTIQFPEKTVKYSTTKGYNLAFKKGTNITVVPNVVDAKTSVSLKGLIFELQGSDWVPTAGTITYTFLGQKGVEDLTDFLAP